jgi:peptide/nickel transport system permease protein
MRNATAARPSTWLRADTVVALVVLSAFAVMALLPGVIALPEGLQSGGPALAPPNAEFPLGTDVLGRDVWARLVHGART